MLGFACALPYFARHSDQDGDYTKIKITLRSNREFETTLQIWIREILYRGGHQQTPLETRSLYMTILSVLTASQPLISSEFDLPRRSGDIVMTMLWQPITAEPVLWRYYSMDESICCCPEAEQDWWRCRTTDVKIMSASNETATVLKLANLIRCDLK